MVYIISVEQRYQWKTLDLGQVLFGFKNLDALGMKAVSLCALIEDGAYPHVHIIQILVSIVDL